MGRVLRRCKKHSPGTNEQANEYYWRMQFDPTANNCPACKFGRRAPSKKLISIMAFIAGLVYLLYEVTENLKWLADWWANQ